MKFPLLKTTKLEHLRYEVESQTPGQGVHMVDLMDNFCSCVDHQTRVKAGERPFCKHGISARLSLAEEMLVEIRKQSKK